jgi:hypothetical protein
MRARRLPSGVVTPRRGCAGPYRLRDAHVDSGEFSMTTTVLADRAADHPTRDPADHANLDPRRSVKHPKVSGRPRPGTERPGRG